MGSRRPDRFDIGAEPTLPFKESLFATYRLAAEIFSNVPVEQRATLLRAIRLQYEDFVSRNAWQTLELLLRR